MRCSGCLAHMKWARTALGAATVLGLLGACSSGSHQAEPPVPSTPAQTSVQPVTVPSTKAPSSASTAPTAPPTTRPRTAAPVGSEWLTYHADNARLGVAATQPSLDPLHLAWTAALDGTAVYGQPLIADGRVRGYRG
jgi:hypothetical protein